MKLALQLPWDPAGSTKITIDPAANPAQKFPADNSFELAKVINTFGEAALYVAAVLMFFWAAWGVFDYLKAEGNKEGLAKARKKIQWSIAGFIIVIMAFFVSDYIREALIYIPFGAPSPGSTPPPITPP